MKKLLPFFAILILVACDKQNVSQPSLTSTVFVSSSTQGDTIVGNDGRRMVIQCHCDTTYIDEAARPTITVGSSSTSFLPDTSFSGYHIIKLGYYGFSFGNLRYNVNWDSIIALHPKQILLQGGENDIFQKRPLNSMQTDWQAIVNRLMTAIPDLNIVFIYIKPTGPNKLVMYNSTDNGWAVSKYFNRNMTNWALANYPNSVYAVNTYDPFLIYDPVTKTMILNNLLYQTDLTHLNVTNGYPVYVAAIKPKLLN
jgi:hypothetical protein